MEVQIQSIQKGVPSPTRKSVNRAIYITSFFRRHLMCVYQVVKAVFVAKQNMWNRVYEQPTLTFLNVIPIQASLSGDSGLISNQHIKSVQRTALYSISFLVAVLISIAAHLTHQIQVVLIHMMYCTFPLSSPPENKPSHSVERDATTYSGNYLSTRLGES